MTNIYGYGDNYFDSVTIGNPAYTLPIEDGDPSYVLQTDGKGIVEWAPQSGGGTGSETLTSLTVTGTTNLQDVVTCDSSLSATTLRATSSGSATITSIQIGSAGTGFYKSTSTQCSLSISSTPSYYFDSTTFSSSGAKNLGSLSLPFGAVWCGNIIQGASNTGFLGITQVESLTSNGAINSGSNSLTCGSITSRAINAGTFGLTCGSLSPSSISTSGGITCQSLICGDTSTSTPINLIASGDSLDCGKNMIIDAKVTVANYSGITVGDSTAEQVRIGVNRVAVTGQLSPLCSFITTRTTNGKFAIGRGNGSTLPSTADIMLNGDGSVSCTNGLLTVSSLSSGSISATSILSSGTINSGTNGIVCGSISSTSIACTNLTSSGTMSCGSNAFTCGALSAGSITGTGAINIGNNGLTCGVINSSSLSSGTTSITCGSIVGTPSSSPFRITSNNGSSTDGYSSLWIDATTPTAGLLYGIGVNKQGVGAIVTGINKNTTTGQLPASFAYLSTHGTSIGLGIGRGNGAGLPDTTDILISTAGSISMTNGQLSCSSISAGTNSITCGPLTCTTFSRTNYFLDVQQTATGQTIPNAVQTIVYWDQENRDDNFNFTPSTSATNISVPVTGTYLTTTSIYFPGGVSTTYKTTSIIYNTTEKAIVYGPGGSPNIGQSASAMGRLTAGQNITVRVTQNTGASIDLLRAFCQVTLLAAG